MVVAELWASANRLPKLLVVHENDKIIKIDALSITNRYMELDFRTLVVADKASATFTAIFVFNLIDH
jgi:hypothetical protein